jgi:hypothetical protein
LVSSYSVTCQRGLRLRFIFTSSRRNFVKKTKPRGQVRCLTV